MARAVRSDSKCARSAFAMALLLAFGCSSDGRSSDVGRASPGVSGSFAGGVSSAGTTNGNGGRFADAEGGQAGEVGSGGDGREAGAAGEAPTGPWNDGGANGDAGAASGGAAGAPGMTDSGGSSVVAGVGSSGDAPAGTAGTAASGGAAGALGAAGASGFGGAGPVNSLPCEVRAVLKARCQACHQDPPLNGAPMRLLTWSDVYGKADEIYERLSADEMPPPGAPDLSQDQASTLFTYLSLGTPAAGNVTCR